MSRTAGSADVEAPADRKQLSSRTTCPPTWIASLTERRRCPPKLLQYMSCLDLPCRRSTDFRRSPGPTLTCVRSLSAMKTGRLRVELQARPRIRPSKKQALLFGLRDCRAYGPLGLGWQIFREKDRKPETKNVGLSPETGKIPKIREKSGNLG